EIERLQAELAKAEASIKQERDAKDKISADKDRIYNEKVALEKQLAEANGREKATAQRLAEAEGREKKERDAKDKLTQEQQTLRAKMEADAKAAQERERLAKEADAKLKAEQARLAAGPEMPASLPDKLHCSAPDETPPGVDLYVHCAVKSELKADELTLHVRPSGSARFHAFAMNRSPKGWYVAMVPAVLLKGSTLQYFVQVAASNGKVVASNGKPGFPNVIMVNRHPSPSDPSTATAAAEEPPPAKLVKARAQSRRATR
ncbi:MAG TPA: cell envelope integrity protein TolA, partial [Polyangia bacterium]